MGVISEQISKLKDGIADALGGSANIHQRAFGNKDYVKIEGSDWDKVYAYRFVVEYNPVDKDDTNGQNITSTLSKIANVTKNILKGNVFNQPKFEKLFYFTLPIPPQSITIKPVIASNATATLGGVVEETSPTTFWMIQMSGTTGTGIGRDTTDLVKKQQLASDFRNVIKTTGMMASQFSKFNDVIAKFVRPFDKVVNAIDNPSVGGLAAGLAGVANESLVPNLPYNSSGVKSHTNGFKEMFELSRFFNSYQKIKSDNPARYALRFEIHKTNQSWRAIVKNFEIKQNAREPHLYKYEIVLQCWDMTSVGADEKVSLDRFGPGGDLAPTQPNASVTLSKLKKLNLKKIGK